MSVAEDVAGLAERVGRIEGVVAVILFGSYARQEQDVRQGVAIEASRRDDRHPVGRGKRAVSQQPKIDQRSAMP